MDTLDKILILIRKNGFSDQKFCTLVGLNKAALYDWRSGKTKSYLKHLPKIAAVLNTTTEFLLENTFSTDSAMPEKLQVILTEAADLDEEELTRVKEYVEFVKSKRKSKDK